MAVLDGFFRGKPVASEEGAPASRRYSAMVVIAAAVVVMIAATVPLVQDSGATARGYDLRDMERTRDDWQARVHGLESDLAELGSLDRIEREATRRLGMVVPETTIYIETSVSGPADVSAPSYLVPAADAGEPAGSRPWWERLLETVLP